MIDPIASTCDVPWCRNVHTKPPGKRAHVINIDTIDAGPLSVEVDGQLLDGDTPRVRLFIGEDEDRHVDLSPQASAELGRLIAGLNPQDLRYLARLLSKAGALLLGKDAQ